MISEHFKANKLQPEIDSQGKQQNSGKLKERSLLLRHNNPRQFKQRFLQRS
jgi:hypothetical protein